MTSEKKKSKGRKRIGKNIQNSSIVEMKSSKLINYLAHMCPSWEGIRCLLSFSPFSFLQKSPIHPKP
jgi:hypothetical protein